MQDAKNPLHAFWPKVHKDDVPNAARPVNRAAEIRLIHHGLTFLLTYMAGRVGEAKVGVFNKCWHCRAQMSHSSHPLGCPHKWGQHKWGWYPLNSSFVVQSCVLLSILSLIFLSLQEEFQMSDGCHLSSFKGDFPAFWDSNWDLSSRFWERKLQSLEWRIK